MVNLLDVWNKYRRWCRLVILLHEGGETVYKDTLYKIGVTDITDGAEIYRKLEPYKAEIKKMASFQKKPLLPPGKVIDTNALDFSLHMHIIKILDTARYSSIDKLRIERNTLFHMPDDERDMTEQQFQANWDRISQLLTDLNFSMKSLSGLKTDNHLSEENQKRFKDALLQRMEGRAEFLFLFFCISKNND